MRAGASFSAALWAVMSSAACGSGSAWELGVNVRIPPTVLDGYDGEYPAQIVVSTDAAPPNDPASTGGTPYRIANLCKKPSDTSDTSSDTSDMSDILTYQATWSGTDCDAPRYVRAWLEPRDVGAESKCGSLEPPSEITGLHRPPGEGSPRGEGTGFDDACGVDRKDVTITLSFRRR